LRGADNAESAFLDPGADQPVMIHRFRSGQKKSEGKTLRFASASDQPMGLAATAAAAESAAPVSAAAIAASAPALFALLGFVDLDLAAIDLLAIELLDGGLGRLIRAHGHKGEAARPARFAIHGHAHILDFAGDREFLFESFPGGIE
jgi:hypothetical protein